MLLICGRSTNLAYHGYHRRSTMKVTRHIANSLMRFRAQSLCCLVAAFLLQGPLMAGLIIASGGCCTGDHCPIAAHHHATAKTAEAPMDCDHKLNHSGAKVRSCSMSCCDSTEQSAVHSHVFLLSPVIELASANPLCEGVSAFAADATAAFFAPLSPPPKSLHSPI